MNKKIIWIIILIFILSFVLKYQNIFNKKTNNEKDINSVSSQEKDALSVGIGTGKEDSQTVKDSKQEFILENLIDSINESFLEQAKTLSGQSAIEMYDNLSYVYNGGKEDKLNGLCAKYSKITSSGQKLAQYPIFNFSNQYQRNVDYKSTNGKDYSVFYKDKKVSCEVIFTDQTERICCLYYDGPDPRFN
jgi:hypothetical protein